MDGLQEAVMAAAAEAKRRGDQHEIAEVGAVLLQICRTPVVSADLATDISFAAQQLSDLVSKLQKHSSNQHLATCFFVLLAMLPEEFTVVLPEALTRPALAVIVAAIDKHTRASNCLPLFAEKGLLALASTLSAPLNGSSDDCAVKDMLALAGYAALELASAPTVVACMQQHVSRASVQVRRCDSLQNSYL